MTYGALKIQLLVANSKMIVHNKRLGVVAVLLLCLCSATAQAQLYRCQDAGGQALFQSNPCVVELVKDTSLVGAEIVDFSSEKHFLWQASAGKGTLYLLGSIHFGTSDIYPLPRVMISMFQRSQVLVVEADVVNVNPRDLAPLIAAKAYYQKGERLQQHLSPETWQRLSLVATKLGLSIDMLNDQKPWFVSMTLMALALNRMGFSEEAGIDRHFINLAQGKKKLVELESIAWQLSLFDQFSDVEQVMVLEETLNELEYGPEYFEKMLAYWRSGDQAGIQSMFDESAEKQIGLARFQKVIMIDRNYSMTDKLHKMANQGGDYFVVVGAGHLTGSEGIVSLLEQRGYTLEQL